MIEMGIEYDITASVDAEDGQLSLYQAFATVNGEKKSKLPCCCTVEERADGSLFGVWAVKTPAGTYLRQVDGANEDEFFDVVMELTEQYLWDGSIK